MTVSGSAVDRAAVEALRAVASLEADNAFNHRAARDVYADLRDRLDAILAAPVTGDTEWATAWRNDDGSFFILDHYRDEQDARYYAQDAGHAKFGPVFAVSRPVGPWTAAGQETT